MWWGTAGLWQTMRQPPSASLARIADTQDFDPDVIEHNIDGLRKAGLPE